MHSRLGRSTTPEMICKNFMVGLKVLWLSLAVSKSHLLSFEKVMSFLKTALVPIFIGK